MLKPKKPSSFFTSLDESMEPNLSQKFTEELVGISWIEFKLFISNWKRFDLYFPLLKPKKRAGFFFFWMKAFEWNLGQKALKLASNDNYFTEELNSSSLFQTERDLTSIFPC